MLAKNHHKQSCLPKYWLEAEDQITQELVSLGFLCRGENTDNGLAQLINQSSSMHPTSNRNLPIMINGGLPDSMVQTFSSPIMAPRS